MRHPTLGLPSRRSRGGALPRRVTSHRPLSRRARTWLVGLLVLDAIVLAVTLHATLTFHRSANGPSVMTFGQAVGWIVVAILTVAVGLVVKESRR